jgi:diadenosine tetraphosphate (Ap4A) HIT family hydrolase
VGALFVLSTRQTRAVSDYPKVPFDAQWYERRVRGGPCFICAIVDGSHDDHLVVFRDDICIAFLAKWPTLVGYTLLAPLEHRTDVVADFTEDQYEALQRRIHRLGRAVSAAVPTERLYVLSLGSHQGNAHVHWHLAPLPGGVPYERQQLAALIHESGGYLDIPDNDLAHLAAQIRARVEEGD